MNSTKSTVRVSDNTLENAYYRVEINPVNGNISRFYDKVNDREVFADGQEGNILQFLGDKYSRKDAWDIKYDGREWQCDSVASIQIIENGPVRGVLRVERIFQNSSFTQDYTIYQGIPRLDIKTSADWHEHHILLKAVFPVDVHTEEANYDIAYGTLQRPTHPRTKAEKAKWEVAAHMFVDLSQPDYGVSLLNNCKYGYDIHDNRIRITLLRSPKTPQPIELPPDYEQPYADMGHHEFTYSLYPHSGDYVAANTKQKAYELNYPLLANLTDTHKGSLPSEHSFVTVNADNVMVCSVKKAEDSDNSIIRLFETLGHPANVALALDTPIAKAWTINMIEDRQESLPVDDGKISFSLKPYEIYTVEVQK